MALGSHPRVRGSADVRAGGEQEARSLGKASTPRISPTSEEEKPEHKPYEDHRQDEGYKEKSDGIQHGLPLLLARCLGDARCGHHEDTVICIGFAYPSSLLQVLSYPPEVL